MEFNDPCLFLNEETLFMTTKSSVEVEILCVDRLIDDP